MAITTGADIDGAVEFLLSLGPAGEILRLAGELAAHVHDRIADALHQASPNGSDQTTARPWPQLDRENTGVNGTICSRGPTFTGPEVADWLLRPRSPLVAEVGVRHAALPDPQRGMARAADGWPMLGPA